MIHSKRRGPYHFQMGQTIKMNIVNHFYHLRLSDDELNANHSIIMQNMLKNQIRQLRIFLNYKMLLNVIFTFNETHIN